MSFVAIDAHNLGVTIGALMVPLIGLILLTVGIIERTRSRKQLPPMPPGYVGHMPPTAHSQPPYPPLPPGHGYPTPPTYTPYPPPPGHWPPPPPRPKPRGTGLMITGAVILGFSLIGGVLRVAESSDASSSRSPDGSDSPGHIGSAKALKIGQCVADSDFAKREPKPTDCNNPSAVMELVSRGGANANCPDGKGHAETDYTTLFWDDATMCFAASLQEHHCYAVNMADPSESPFTHEDCDDPRADIEVVQRLEGITDPTQCSPGTKPVSYKQPARLYCLKAAKSRVALSLSCRSEPGTSAVAVNGRCL